MIFVILCIASFCIVLFVLFVFSVLAFAVLSCALTLEATNILLPHDNRNVNKKKERTVVEKGSQNLAVAA